MDNANQPEPRPDGYPPISDQPPAVLPTESRSPVATPGSHAARDRSSARLTVTILLGVLIALALIGLGYYAYQSSQEDEPEPANQTTAQTDSEQLDTTSPVDSSAVDKEQADADAAVNGTDESYDFPENETSDSTLGL